MYFVINRTKTNIVIGDIGVSLGPRQAMDLDRRMKRDKSDSSQQLKKLIRNGTIKVKIKDGGKKEKEVTSRVEMNVDMSQIKDEVRKEMAKGIKEVKNEIQGIPKPEQVSMEGLNEMMQQMMSMMQNQGINIVNKSRGDEEVQVDEETLANMHARAVDKLAEKGETGAVDYKEEKVKDTITEKADELEDLLG